MSGKNSILGNHKQYVLDDYLICLKFQNTLTLLFCFGSLVILDVARCYLWLFTLYINIKIGKNSC